MKKIWNLVKKTKKDLNLNEKLDTEYAYKIIKHLELYGNTSLSNKVTELSLTNEEWLESWKLYQLIVYKKNFVHKELSIFYKNLLVSFVYVKAWCIPERNQQFYFDIFYRTVSELNFFLWTFKFHHLQVNIVVTNIFTYQLLSTFTENCVC